MTSSTGIAGPTRRRRGAALTTLILLVAALLAATSSDADAGRRAPRCGGKRATKVGTNGPDRIVGTKRADVIVARGGADVIFGKGGRDLICAGRGNDLIFGQGGNDVLLAGPGDDGMEGGPGNDRFVGGPGTLDSAFFFLSPAAVQVDLAAGTATGFGSDRLRGVESVNGSDFNDHIAGTEGPDTLSGGGGDDVIVGGSGVDGLSGGLGNDTLDGGEDVDLAFYLASETPIEGDLGAGTVIGEGSDTLVSIEGLSGTEGNDTLTGSDEINFLFGGGGDDVIDGGGRLDVVFFIFATEGVTVDLSEGTSTGEGSDTYQSIEGAWGSPFGDHLIGDGGDNLFFGDTGDDTIDGGAGDDWIVGALGDDEIDGGAGDYDLIDHSTSPAAVQVDLAAGSAAGGEGNDSLTGIEAVFGSLFDDTIAGDDAANFLFGYEGADVIDGAAGNDILDGGSGVDVLTGGDGTDQCGSDVTDQIAPTCEGTGVPPDHPLFEEQRVARIRFH